MLGWRGEVLPEIQIPQDLDGVEDSMTKKLLGECRDAAPQARHREQTE